MFDATTLLIYASAALILLVTPGPAIIYTVTRSIDQGRKAGLLSILGIALGSFPHALAVALGLAAILASSITLFSIIKYIGAAYLVYLGIGRFRHKRIIEDVDSKKPKIGTVAFVQSFMVGLSNPKTILFFIAFLPQFVDPTRGNPAVQTMLLWCIFETLGVTVGSAYALTAASVRDLVTRRKGFSNAGRYVSGSVYIGLGLAAVLTGSKSK